MGTPAAPLLQVPVHLSAPAQSPPSSPARTQPGLPPSSFLRVLSPSPFLEERFPRNHSSLHPTPLYLLGLLVSQGAPRFSSLSLTPSPPSDRLPHLSELLTHPAPTCRSLGPLGSPLQRYPRSQGFPHRKASDGSLSPGSHVRRDTVLS